MSTKDFFDYDLEHGIKYMKLAVIQALDSIESGKKSEVELSDISFHFIHEIALSLGWIDANNDDCFNGWQHDYWWNMISKNKKLVIISGSWYYGNTKVYIKND